MSPLAKPSHRSHTRLICALLLAVLGWLALAPAAAPAAAAGAAAALGGRTIDAGVAIPPGQGTPVELRLAALNVVDQLLDSSGDITSVSFGLPASWRLDGGAQLHMHFAATVIGWEETPERPVTAGRIALRVMLNGQRIGLIPIVDSIEQTVTLPIPDGLLTTVAGGERNTLVFALEARLECDELSPIELVIYSDSILQLSHGTGPIQLDLARYPFPLLQNSILTDTVTLVVPQQPSTTELAAAFATAASLRQISNSGDLQLLREGDLSVERRANSHLVLIGQPSRLSLLQDVVFAAPPQGDTFPSMEMQIADGVTQIAVSPWSPEHAVLLLSGADDTAVLKAAQGLETLRRWPQRAGAVALVAEIRHTQSPTIVDGRQSFAQLGMYPETLQGPGQGQVEYRFLLPFNQALPGSATLGLSFAHSALINDARSQITVRLNDQDIGGIRLTDRTAVGSVVQVQLPRTQLQHGMNRLIVDVELRSIPGCGTSGQSDIWLTVRDDSYFEFTPAADELARALPFTLDRFPAPFGDHPDLAELCIVVPPGDPVAWSAAMRIVVTLAGITDSSLVAPAVAFADAVPETLRQSHHLLLVGQPQDLSLLRELDESLPVVFSPGSNSPDDRRSRVVMHFDPPEPQGYIQLVAAPWDARRAVLAVLGRDDHELNWAASGLTRASLRNRLGSQLALVQQDAVVVPQLVAPPAAAAAAPLTEAPSSEATALPIATALPKPTPPPAFVQVRTPAASANASSGLLWAALGLALLLGVGGLVLWVSRRQRHGLY